MILFYLFFLEASSLGIQNPNRIDKTNHLSSISLFIGNMKDVRFDFGQMSALMELNKN